MSACNKFGESILHIACKQSSLETVRFLIGHGADLSITDDYGRTPLHDACWRAQPDFNIVSLILSINANLLLQSDKWGFSPLMYTNRDHWSHWCSFLHYYRNSLWPLNTTEAAGKAAADAGPNAWAAAASEVRQGLLDAPVEARQSQAENEKQHQRQGQQQTTTEPSAEKPQHHGDCFSSSSSSS